MKNIHHKPDGWIENPRYTQWKIQVNLNYHDGNMSEADAEYAAGPEPEHYCCPICFRVDSNHMYDLRHHEARQAVR